MALCLAIVWSLVTATLLWVVVYRHVYPQPYPLIPYNKRSASRILGDIPDLVEHVKRTKEVSGFLFEQCRRLNSPIVQLFLRPCSAPFVFLDDPRETEDILLRRAREFDRAPTTAALFRPVVPHASVVKLTDADFRAQRRLWQDMMAPEYLRRVVAPRVYRSGRELVRLWRIRTSRAEGHPFAAQHDLDVAAFDAICSVILGSDELAGVRSEIESVTSAGSVVRLPPDEDAPADMPSSHGSELFEAISYLTRSAESLMGSPSPGWRHWLIRQRSEYRKYDRIKASEIQRLIRDARERFNRIADPETLGDERDTCAMDLVLRREMIAAQKSGTVVVSDEKDSALQDELLALLVAGHETVSMTLGWFTKFMALHPDKQSRLRNAICVAFPTATSADPPSASQILAANVPYLDASIEELNRRANIVPMLVRVATVDTKILGHRIPRGTHIMCNPQISGDYAIPESARSSSSRNAWLKRLGENRDHVSSSFSSSSSSLPQYDINSYAPERWLVTTVDEKVKNGEKRKTKEEEEDTKEIFDLHRLPRLAFSLGIRGCFGRKLAMQELRILIVLMILSFEFCALPDSLNGVAGQQKLLRSAQQCYVKLKSL